MKTKCWHPKMLVVCVWVVWLPGIRVTSWWSGHSTGELEEGRVICQRLMISCFKGIRFTNCWSGHSKRGLISCCASEQNQNAFWKTICCRAKLLVVCFWATAFALRVGGQGISTASLNRGAPFTSAWSVVMLESVFIMVSQKQYAVVPICL